MSRWTQTWLPGSGAGDGEDGPAFRGERLGMPAEGVGSIPGFGTRVLALLVDWAPGYVIGLTLTENPPTTALVVFALLTVVSVSLFDKTPGHAVLGLKVAKLDGSRVGFAGAVIRTVLLCLVVPPLIADADGRGLHDKAAGTVVVRTR